MTVPLPENMMAHLLWALSSLMADRHGNVPAEVRYAHQWLRTMSNTSSTGSESPCRREELDLDDLIGAKEAAQLLRCSPRWVREIKSDLGGVRPAGGRQIFFQRRSVAEYAKAREDHLHEQLAKRGNPHN